MLIKDDALISLLKEIKHAEETADRQVRNYKHVCVAAPSGSGKTRLLKSDERSILNLLPKVYSFSISGTTRLLRLNEKHGKDYFHFSSEIDFKMEDFIETNPYTGNGKQYGTLVSEIERIAIREKKRILFDLDVNGAERVKKIFGDDILLVYLLVSIPVLRQRLEGRKAETGQTQEEIERRLLTAKQEHAKLREREIAPDLIIDYDNMPVDRAVNKILSKAIVQETKKAVV